MDSAGLQRAAGRVSCTQLREQTIWSRIDWVRRVFRKRFADVVCMCVFLRFFLVNFCLVGNPKLPLALSQRGRDRKFGYGTPGGKATR